jgi:acyl carrier protein
MEIAALEQDLIEWVVNWNEGELTAEVDPEINLLSSGLLDSMALIGFISYLEDQADTEFDFESFDPSGEVTIRTIIQHCLGAQTPVE